MEREELDLGKRVSCTGDLDIYRTNRRLLLAYGDFVQKNDRESNSEKLEAECRPSNDSEDHKQQLQHVTAWKRILGEKRRYDNIASSKFSSVVGNVRHESIKIQRKKRQRCEQSVLTFHRSVFTKCNCRSRAYRYYISSPTNEAFSLSERQPHSVNEGNSSKQKADINFFLQKFRTFFTGSLGVQ